MKNRNIIITLIAASLVFACSEKEQAPAPTGSIKLGYRVDQVQLKSGFAGDTAIPKSKPKQLVITVYDSNGKPVLNGERYDLIKIGDAYYSKSILFKTGEYSLEEFIVIDSTDEAIYISPKTGSRLAGFVDDPLPQAFEVKKDSESEVMVQVVPAYLASASDYGYASFPFEVVMPATDTGARLCGTYEEDIQRPGACYDSKECLIGKWWFKGFIGTDSCLVEIPDSVWGVTDWIVLDSIHSPWIEFFENDSIAGESIFGLMPMYTIDENNTIHWNIGSTDVYSGEWDVRFSRSVKASEEFVSFNDTLFLYNNNEKMFFLKEE